ncbi:transglycosylase SLT domain-containing protein [Tianweitania sp. BSSL-BM11]|uniref:Transglycosylase SLT domain-containing protein n=1 Tax=Tianweitania aestuarii TaxID=2814886 RepID=A0ABS5RXA6_9HYPH|nr:transglycosylase SLT domain-containing protein [Tianweitania aestuarii]MBS9720931.1 transglycosylase SLT domain-containing protein [Tianweitania aestuarii]
MTSRTVFAVALAAGVSTFASFSVAQAEGGRAFNPRSVDTMTTGSIGNEAKGDDTASTVVASVSAKGTANAHRPALTAVERSSKKKFSALPGVKPISLDDGKEPVAEKAVAKAVVKGRKFSTIVSRYASAYGVPVSLAHAVISVESNYRQDARGSAGEIGLMQIKPATARMLGYTGSTKGLYDPDTNIKYGMKYLAKAHDLGGGTTCGTILKYNAGHAAKRMNPISAAYCAKVKRKLAGA